VTVLLREGSTRAGKQAVTAQPQGQAVGGTAQQGDAQPWGAKEGGSKGVGGQGQRGAPRGGARQQTALLRMPLAVAQPAGREERGMTGGGDGQNLREGECTGKRAQVSATGKCVGKQLPTS
jgi:hypothetical protein